MGQTFKIQPGDQSLVGKKITDTRWVALEYLDVKFVGSRLVVGVTKDGEEISYDFRNEDFKFYEEPKKNVLMAPAIIIGSSDQKGLSHSLFATENEARDYFVDRFIFWPAIPNKDGFYEVPE